MRSTLTLPVRSSNWEQMKCRGETINAALLLWLHCKGTHFTLLPQFASLSSPLFSTYWRATARLPGRSHGDVPINGRHVQTEQPELTFRTLPACLPVSLREPVRWLKNATTADVRADKGHTGRSLFGLAPLHTLVLQEKKSLEQSGEGCWQGCVRVTRLKQKAMGGGTSPARPQETRQKHQGKP